MQNAAFAFALLLFLCGLGTAQMEEGRFIELPHSHETGPLFNAGSGPAILDTHQASVTGATSMRLFFDNVLMGPGDCLIITSVWDAQEQRLDATELAKWQNSTAYFNGDTLIVNLLVAAGSTASYEIPSLLIEAGGVPSPDSICGPTDDRVLSQDWRAMRAVGSGYCTVWAASPLDCVLSAGHCSGALSVAQSEVPLSTSSGSLVHPPTTRQWPILPGGVMNNGGTGNDYAVRLLGTNSLGELPAQLYGYFNLSTATPTASDMIRVTGYGSTNGTLAPSSWSGVNKTHAGPYAGVTGYRLQYQPDTTGGNSGSPVILESTGDAIGIHTHGGCSSTGGSNSGTHLLRPEVQAALAVVCPPTNLPTLTMASAGTGGVSIELSNIPAGTIEGYTLFSLYTPLPAGQGPLFGLYPDLLTIASFTTPAQSGSLLHFVVPGLPSHFPAVPFVFPPGTFTGLAGVSVDARALLIQSMTAYETTNLVRWTF